MKDAILTGAIPKGTKLYESRIAEETGIGRTPVWQALHALERELLVTAIDKVGYEIVDRDLEDLEEISVITSITQRERLRRSLSED